MKHESFAAQRAHMVEAHLRPRGISSSRVLAAMRAVPRERFVPPTETDLAYADHPLSIGCQQTISQPYIVAYMTELLDISPGDKVLEIGTGSGYQTAILAEIGATVVTIERHEQLIAEASERLEQLGYASRVDFCLDDGTLGCPESAPYEGIIVTAAGPVIPESLKAQLADGGRMVIPVGRDLQHLYIVTRRGSSYDIKRDLAVRFVPLIGCQGHQDE